MSKTTDVPELVRRCFAAYQHKDRAAIEAILADDFHFTSPRDDHIDRREYFDAAGRSTSRSSSFRSRSCSAKATKRSCVMRASR
jgi:ketosteroid isomerase-like protein